MKRDLVKILLDNFTKSDEKGPELMNFAGFSEEMG